MLLCCYARAALCALCPVPLCLWPSIFCTKIRRRIHHGTSQPSTLVPNWCSLIVFSTHSAPAFAVAFCLLLLPLPSCFGSRAGQAQKEKDGCNSFQSKAHFICCRSGPQAKRWHSWGSRASQLNSRCLSSHQKKTSFFILGDVHVWMRSPPTGPPTGGPQEDHRSASGAGLLVKNNNMRRGGNRAGERLGE